MTTASVSEIWHQEMEAAFGGLQVVAPEAQSIRATGDVIGAELAGVGVFGISGTPQRLVRTPLSLRRSPTELLKVCAVRRGRCLIEQSGREISVGPGQLGMYDTARPYRLTWHGTWACDVMTAAPGALAVPERALEGARARTWATTAGAGAMLVQFMTTCVAMAETTAAARHQLAAAGTALLAGTILEQPEAVAEDAQELFRHRIEAYIDQHLDRADLGLATIAAAHHVSGRTVQRVFAGSGQGVAGRIRRLRLEAVRRDLGDARLAHLGIGEISARWCLHDAQWLARAFKVQYRETPSEFRRRAGAP